MGVSIKLNITQNSQSIENNTSNVTVKLICTWDYGSYNHKSPSGSVTIDGTRYPFYANINPNNTTSGSNTIFSKKLDIPHNTEGKKTLSCSATFVTGIGAGTISASASKKLTDIPRAATIVSAPNFNDEGNPTITYSNPAGSAVTSLQACISLDGSKDDIAYRDISKTGTSYTFNLTTAERNVLRNATTVANSRTVRFYVQSVIGGTTYRKYLSKTLSIVNADPTISPTVKDTNEKTIALTGNENVMVKYYSNAAITTSISTKKGAGTKNFKVVCGSKSLTTPTGTINNVESGGFDFTLTDTRGNTVTQKVSKNFINYIKLTCNLSANAPTTDGNMTFTVKGNIFTSSFGAVTNTLTVQYRYKEQGGSYGSWTDLTYTGSGSTYTANGSLTGLDYLKTYVFQARAIDKLATVNSAEKAVNTTPVFDWSKTDFNFNVPVHMANYKQLYGTSTSGDPVMLVSLNSQNQAFFGYGNYEQGLATTYFDGNSVQIRSKNNITNTATGTIGGNKAWTNSSDSRLKTNIEDIPSVFADIWLELQPKMFEWNELNNTDGKKHFGLIAQDAITIFEKYGIDYRDFGFIETVPINDIEYLAITYENYNMITAKVLKDTVKRLSALESEIANIKVLLEVKS